MDQKESIEKVVIKKVPVSQKLIVNEFGKNLKNLKNNLNMNNQKIIMSWNIMYVVMI